MSHHLDFQQSQYLLLFLLDQSHPEKMEKIRKTRGGLSLWSRVMIPQATWKAPDFVVCFAKMTWDVDRDHYIFNGLTGFPHMLGGKHYIATKPPCGCFSTCVVIGSGNMPRNYKMPLIQVYSRNYSSLPWCVCVGAIFPSCFIAAYVQRCKDKCMSCCIFILVCIGKYRFERVHVYNFVVSWNDR